MDMTAEADMLKRSSRSGPDHVHKMEMLAMMMQMDHHSTFHNNSLPEINNLSGTNTNDTIFPSLFCNPNTVVSCSSSSSSSSPLTDEKKMSIMSSNMESMREVIFRMAVMQPVDIDPEAVKPRKRRNVKISKDPQSVAARLRRERISQKMRILQRLVPGGTNMDTASMLDEAIHYVNFLKKLLHSLEQLSATVGGENNVMPPDNFLKPISSQMLLRS